MKSKGLVFVIGYQKIFSRRVEYKGEKFAIFAFSRSLY